MLLLLFKWWFLVFSSYWHSSSSYWSLRTRSEKKWNEGRRRRRRSERLSIKFETYVYVFFSYQHFFLKKHFNSINEIIQNFSYFRDTLKVLQMMTTMLLSKWIYYSDSFSFLLIFNIFNASSWNRFLIYIHFRRSNQPSLHAQTVLNLLGVVLGADLRKAIKKHHKKDDAVYISCFMNSRGLFMFQNIVLFFSTSRRSGEAWT